MQIIMKTKLRSRAATLKSQARLLAKELIKAVMFYPFVGGGERGERKKEMKRKKLYSAVKPYY